MWAAFAARALGWRPDEFWRATPSELVGALSDPLGEQVQAPPSRDLITQLMERDAHG
ncbi:MAG: phage tail assembly chaperone [Pseudomonadota bacterium]